MKKFLPWEHIRFWYCQDKRSMKWIKEELGERGFSASLSHLHKIKRTEGWKVGDTMPLPASKLPAKEAGRGLLAQIGSKDRVLQALDRGATLGLAAQSAGINKSTLLTWRKNDPEFSQLCEAIRGERLVKCAQVIDDAAQRDWNAARFVLQHAPETRDEYAAPKSDGSTVAVQINFERD